MTLLLYTHTAVRSRPDGTLDEHGWELPPDGTGPTYECNFQMTDTIAGAQSYVGADGDGGSGPYGPRVVLGGTVYMDEDADVKPGDVLTIDGQEWQVRLVRPSPDPVGTGVGCQVVEVST